MKLLNSLEDESISFIRDTYKDAENPVVLYSIGKDSSVMLHLFKKAFYPLNVPIPFMHIDTTWKFSEMINFRDKVLTKNKIKKIVYTNRDGVKAGVNPFNNDKYTDIMKTQALKDALDKYNFDFIYGGARRDEEASRSKEKVLSIRDKYHKWNPIDQTIEPWYIFNTFLPKESSFRVFPISNWTELNIWQYILKEEIDVVPLYFAKKRKVVVSNEQYFLYDDKRYKLKKEDKIINTNIRFRTLGCYPLTAGVLSNVKTVTGIIRELNESQYSERSGRLIDHDQIGSMEKKKKDGYF